MGPKTILYVLPRPGSHNEGTIIILFFIELGQYDILAICIGYLLSIKQVILLNNSKTTTPMTVK